LEGVYRRREEASALFDAYERLSQRFEQDLAGERDVLLSKGAALMMIKYWLEENGSDSVRG
jgi:type II secretory pathway component PulM